MRIDNDIRKMPRDQLIIEVMKLREGIRQNKSACVDCGHNLCHFNPELWVLLPEAPPPVKVPNFWVFLWNCLKYRWWLRSKLNRFNELWVGQGGRL